MGGKESKQSCIAYEEAVKRVSDAEFRRLKDAFKKSAGIGRLYLTEKAFRQDVLCEGVPADVTTLLYTACGGTTRGISFKDLLCGLVLITRGSREEKTRFLWNLYCNDTGSYITKADYARAVKNHPGEISSLFGNSERVNFEQFKDWISKNQGSTVLSRWLLSDKCVSLTSELETPTFYQSLAGVTHLEEKDIGDLEKEFWRMKNTSQNGQIDMQFLGPLISPPIPKNALTGLFNAFDENRDGHIDFKELCCGVSAACRGPTVERTRFCFKTFDVDRDGVLNHNETLQMVNVLLFVAKENHNSCIYRDIYPQDVISDLIEFLKRKYEQSVDAVNKNRLQLLTRDDISLTAEDFMMWSVESNLKLMQPFLDLVYELCHVVFGLYPQCRHLEADIVRGWLTREQNRQYRVGQFWYLISCEWWQSWIQYTNNPAAGCDCVKINQQRSLYPAGVDEALVVDENFSSNYIVEHYVEQANVIDNYSLASASSSLSMTRQAGQLPGPIDNRDLILPNSFKDTRTLTGEGGHLKRDRQLMHKVDYELIPKSLWKALNRWYGDKIPLPRQVIQPPDSDDVELELYPLNLRIFAHQAQQATPSLNSWGSVSGGYGVIASGGSYAAMNSAGLSQPPKRVFKHTAAFSRLATIRQIGEFLCEQLHLKFEDIRLWHLPTTSFDTTAILLEEDTMTLMELFIKDNDQLLLEVRNKDLTWPEELGSLTLNQNSSSINDRRMTRGSIMSVHPPGATGLHNLGNTCFMNAALQVLFNTQPLAQYFHRNMHMIELNIANKLGTRGQLATRYGELLKEIWTANTRSVAPLKLRFCVTKNAPQFAGGGQHDSQELLEWFLDALHEDLNRVTEKPYSELRDSNGRPDKMVAAEAWTQHNSRNQSIIIDLFYGQLKSKVSCLGCGHESLRFDPFSLLSLPLPVENYVYFEVLIILLDGSVPTKYGLRLNSDSRYIDLKQKLATLSYLNPNSMLVCEMCNSQIKQILPDEEKVKSAGAKELYVYQLPEECSYGSQTNSTLSIQIEKGLKDIQRSTALTTTTLESLSSVSSLQAHNQKAVNSVVRQPESVHDHDGAHAPNNYLMCNGNAQSDFDDHPTDEQMTSKVSRCFGNTMCMPQNLLCFKLKRVSSSKLLNNNGSNTCSSYSGENSLGSSTAEVSPADSNPACQCGQSAAVCSCRLDSIMMNDLTTQSVENPVLDGNCCGGSQLEHSYANQTSSGIFSRTVSQQSKPAKYLFAMHRKITRHDSYFLSYHKTRPSLFGVPLLVPNYEGGSNKDLYCAVWAQVNRLLSPLPASTEQSNHAADCDDSLGYDFPFTLRAVKRDGLTCAICPWSNFCRGCEISCNNELVPQFVKTGDNKMVVPPNSGDFTVAIDWDPTALHLRYQSTLERLWIDHETVMQCRREQFEPVDLNHCLRAFTSEEKLEETYNCSICKGKKPATKKLQIWKLPPILIVHLKRFNCVNGKWVKSQKVVHFPFDNFDPTPFLASVPQETILRHKELLELRKSEQCLRDTQPEAESSDDEELTTSLSDEAGISDRNEIVGDSKESNLKNKQSKPIKRRRLVSSSLTKTPIVDGEFEDFHHHKLKTGEDTFDPKYKLYAVVSHSGMLNGGHFISYAANANGSWYCYNDSSCREISNEPNIDPSAAYLLFYERKGLDYEPYLPNIDSRALASAIASREAEEVDNDLKKLCLIS